MTLSSVRLAVMTTVTVLLVGLFLPYYCFAASYDYSYWLLDHPDGSNRYQLTVSVTSSLYEYYRSKDHNLYSYDFAKFVTPYALKPVADNLWSIYSDDEDFANGVLMIVHQIPYEESAPQKYPVETIVENKGDCDLMSFVAASVMMAGGLDVVLLYYESQRHMNVGVNLSHPPDDARSTVYYFSYAGKRYYMAETTGGNWEKGWRVGECPDEFKKASARIITLENAEQASPGQVSSSYSTLASSSITLALSSTLLIQGGTVTISGLISPAHSNKIIIIYVSSGGSAWNILRTVTSDSNGQYSYTWSPDSAGTYSIRASWSGDVDHAGSDSDILTLTVIPVSWLLIAIAAVAFVSIATLIIATSKRSRIPAENLTFPSES